MAELWWWIEPLGATGFILTLLISIPASLLLVNTDNAIATIVLLLIGGIPPLMVLFSGASTFLWIVLDILWRIWT